MLVSKRKTPPTESWCCPGASRPFITSDSFSRLPWCSSSSAGWSGLWSSPGSACSPCWTWCCGGRRWRHRRLGFLWAQTSCWSPSLSAPRREGRLFPGHFRAQPQWKGQPWIRSVPTFYCYDRHVIIHTYPDVSFESQRVTNPSQWFQNRLTSYRVILLKKATEIMALVNEWRRRGCGRDPNSLACVPVASHWTPCRGTATANAHQATRTRNSCFCSEVVLHKPLHVHILRRPRSLSSLGPPLWSLLIC